MTPARRWWLASGITLLALAVFVWFRHLGPSWNHAVWRGRVQAQIRSLKDKRPADVSPERWECVTTWTINLHANCGYWDLFDSGTHVDPVWRDEFVAELERRASGPLTLADIDWIWDEYAAHIPRGQGYSDSYRPTRADVCPR